MSNHLGLSGAGSCHVRGKRQHMRQLHRFQDFVGSSSQLRLISSFVGRAHGRGCRVSNASPERFSRLDWRGRVSNRPSKRQKHHRTNVQAQELRISATVFQSVRVRKDDAVISEAPLLPAKRLVRSVVA